MREGREMDVCDSVCIKGKRRKDENMEGIKGKKRRGRIMCCDTGKEPK